MRCNNLHNNTDTENDITNNNAKSATNLVCDRSSYNGPNQRSYGKLDLVSDFARPSDSVVCFHTRPTIVPDLLLLKAGFPFFVVSPKRSRKSGIARNPEIWPVS